MSSFAARFNRRLAPRFAPLALMLAAACGQAVAADPAPAASAAPAAAAEPHKPLLWKVSDSDNSLYLLGSIHLLKKTDYPLSSDIDRAFDDAEHVMFELDLPSLTTPESQAMFAKAMGFSDGRKLSDVLSAQAREKLEAMLKVGGGTMAQVEQLEPWAMSLTFTMGIFQALGFQADAGVDKHIEERARAAGKPITTLETLADQLAAMDGAPMAEQVAGLEEFVADPAATVKQAQSLHRAWLAGDVEAIDREMRAEMATKSPQSYKLMNVDRNNAWMGALEARLKDQTKDDTLTVVGALHLVGNDGVVEKLRAKGYRVERICTACASETAPAKR